MENNDNVISFCSCCGAVCDEKDLAGEWYYCKRCGYALCDETIIPEEDMTDPVLNPLCYDDPY